MIRMQDYGLVQWRQRQRHPLGGVIGVGLELLPLVNVATMDPNQNLNNAFKTADREKVCSAIFDLIAGTGNVSAFAAKAGLERSMLYRAPKRNIRLDIVLKILRAADLKLIVNGHPALNSAFETEETTLIGKALKVALRTHENIRRGDSLYNLIRPPHIPGLEAVLRSLNALGVRMAVQVRKNYDKSHNLALL